MEIRLQNWHADFLLYAGMHTAPIGTVHTTGLSLRAGGWGFSPATKRVAPGHFHRKMEEK